MEHLANELDARRLVGVCFFKVHYEAKRSIFERRVCGADNDCIPASTSAIKFRVYIEVAVAYAKHGSGYEATMLSVACGVGAVRHTKS
jgi:hypothetical protein